MTKESRLSIDSFHFQMINDGELLLKNERKSQRKIFVREKWKRENYKNLIFGKIQSSTITSRKWKKRAVDRISSSFFFFLFPSFLVGLGFLFFLFFSFFFIFFLSFYLLFDFIVTGVPDPLSFLFFSLPFSGESAIPRIRLQAHRWLTIWMELSWRANGLSGA